MGELVLNDESRTAKDILRVARTIADFEASDETKLQHFAGAVGYRSLDRSVWIWSDRIVQDLTPEQTRCLRHNSTLDGSYPCVGSLTTFTPSFAGSQPTVRCG